uniref:F-box protein 5 n=2 Tax=Latimeria chalumnae TaxID=7897 RepID=H3AND7_LATCH
EVMNRSGLLDDSGYSSLLYDQPGEEVGTSPVQFGSDFCTPKARASWEDGELPNKNMLPALQFQRAVCSTLKKRSKDKKLDQYLLEKICSEANWGLQNLIGKKMGLETMDIVQHLLLRDMKHLLSKILRCLDDSDLMNFADVSKIWRSILLDDHWAAQTFSAAKERMEEQAEKCPSNLTRSLTSSRGVLASVQNVAITAGQKSPKRLAWQKSCGPSEQCATSRSRYNEFHQIAKVLRNDESLKACKHCGSPARFSAFLQRATCTHSSCGFDFCTKCLCDFHGSKECLTGRNMKSDVKLQPIPGSIKSKRNLKRL